MSEGLTRTELEPAATPRESEEWRGLPTKEPEAPEEHATLEEEAPPPPLDLSQARSLLTELVPAGIGEVLVTDVWQRPQPQQAKGPPAEGEQSGGDWRRLLAQQLLVRRQQAEGAPEPSEPRDEPAGGAPRAAREGRSEPPAEEDRQRAWALRQEMRELGLLRERPLGVFDARTEAYWNQVRDARARAPQALVDPYTDLVCAFADVDLEDLGAHARNAREYGMEADSLLALGRGYLVIGKLRGARHAFRAAVKKEPLHAEAWWHLGVADLFARANKDAAEALQRASDQLPGDLKAEMPLALARYHLREYAAAEEHFRRLAGSSGPRAAARSLLGCCLRMQEKWDEARVELGFLRQSTPPDWAQVAEQCLDCVARGEGKRAGPLRARRRTSQMVKSLAAVGAGVVWILYARAQDLFREQMPWAVVPLFLAALALTQALRGLSGRELPGEFGNAEQGLPCWQTTTWMRPRRTEF